MSTQRIEKDFLGERVLPAEAYYGIQTLRATENFPITGYTIHSSLIKAMGIVKKAAALSNMEVHLLSKEIGEAIVEAAQEVIDGKWDAEFIVDPIQGGAGTSINMNANEVIANRALEILGKEKGDYHTVSPNSHVNMSQSTNDAFPTAIHIAVLNLIDELLVTMDYMQSVFHQKAEQFAHVIKMGRTHLQDATPLTLGQEIGGWAAMLAKSEHMIIHNIDYMKELAIGGTAVGTGINAHPEFGDRVAEEISVLTGKQFTSAANKFHALTSHDEAVVAHGALKALAADLMKIANDVRWLASGPRSGIGEITIPENEPGSSIMPGKVNPTQSEAMTMVVTQVVGNDATIAFAASQGNFELNVFKPVIIYNFLQSTRLLADTMKSFNDHCAVGIEPNKEVLDHNLQNSLMLVTALNPYIGYENAAKIAKQAHKEGTTLKAAAIASGLLTEEQFDEYVDPATMIYPNVK